MTIVKIREANISDSNELAHLHKESFGRDHFTTNFPLKLLNNYFEYLILHFPYKLIVTNNDGTIRGYLFAAKKINEQMNLFLKANLLRVFCSLISNPRFLTEKIKEFVSRFLIKGIESDNEISLYLIAIDQKFKGSGIGGELITHFEKELILKNEKSYNLSVRKGHDSAIGFYLKLNFIQIDENKTSIKFRKSLEYIEHSK
jgi:ribosomal protein S18 acetylase RimI-like enzyme